MSNPDIHPNKYSELQNIYKHYIDSYIALYQLKTEKEEDLNSIYKMIKTELIDSNKYPPQTMIRDILNIILCNNRYAKSYLFLTKLISDNYHVTEVSSIAHISNFLFYKEYGIKLYKSYDFKEFNSENLDIHIEDTIYRAIMNNDKEKFITFTERDEFDKNQTLESDLYPLLELCCYHRAVDCFKLLRTKFSSEITEKCLRFSFLGRNQEIMSECLKYQKPDDECMKYAIISHNIDFVTFLMNEYNIEIDLDYCGMYNNLESFLIYFDQTNDINKCFANSAMFNIQFLHIAAEYNCYETAELLISQCININIKTILGKTALHIAAHNNRKEMAELLISHGININEKDNDRKTALHIAEEYNCYETAELLISHGININEKDNDGKTALHIAARYKYKEMAELLISQCININIKTILGNTALHIAAYNNTKEIVELLISHGININEKNKYGETALHIAACNNSKETAELLISHGININEKNAIGQTALHIAAEFNCYETAELLISHGININEKDNDRKTALHIAAHNNSKEMVELLISHGININEKDKDGETALDIAGSNNIKSLISHSVNIKVI
ncbi:ankyrin repeat protein, putative [Trichomonas vaginalis G3]|uniref:Ankyrin repeat protein, putative n=1 Tax=Trichomonas vaginalis (strain ATCC PRA-98 / G3) TaxID=412133 RepID=A2ENG6_TRIV3|nr:ankyrin repeat and SOCS box-containing protein 4 family [Trichomonas vaginalis G3]EAY05836.1 ankyrin repeat protein, putative [Trichomonas vaginalis G3]KAI5516386.1 ankyrin repeat and SOCS box-containing protein 4 family [Trichomonas vaginalis G3]|eukprot:XP_001318059.1 ankyrin repeat protein [Trichomonas vaginalis G3]